MVLVNGMVRVFRSVAWCVIRRRVAAGSGHSTGRKGTCPGLTPSMSSPGRCARSRRCNARGPTSRPRVRTPPHRCRPGGREAGLASALRSSAGETATQAANISPADATASRHVTLCRLIASMLLLHNGLALSGRRRRTRDGRAADEVYRRGGPVRRRVMRRLARRIGNCSAFRTAAKALRPGMTVSGESATLSNAGAYIPKGGAAKHQSLMMYYNIMFINML